MSPVSPQDRLRAFESDLALKAGAGSGKTYALVNFYLDLIKGKVEKFGPLDCRSIIALTFTEKAAEEMRERIGREMQQAGLYDQLDRFDQAVIGTIHGFCSALLREFAFEAGVDPDFEVLEGGDLLHRAALETALAGLDQDDPDVALLNRMLDFSGSGGLVKTLTTSLSLARTMGQSVDQILTDIQTRRERIPALESELKLAIRARLDEISRTPIKKGFSYTERLEILAALAGRPVEGELPQAVVENLKGSVPKTIKPIKEVLLQKLAELEALGHEPDALDAAGAAARFMGRVEAAYAELKAARGVLDFDDLQLLARELLFSRPEVRQRLKERFSLILIDEFQDTNPLQWDIFTCLRERLDRSAPVPRDGDPLQVLELDPARLVVVGDAKQSIYRFRGAEVGLFAGLVDELEKQGRGGVVELPFNWRSQPGLVEFFNAFYAWQAEGLDQGRPLIQAWYSAQQAAKQGPGEACVEFLETEAGGNQAQSMELEARAVAARIRQLVDAAQPRPGREEGYRFGDVALLVRSTTNLGLLEEALTDQSVPYVVEQAGGGLKVPEVRDIVNFLDYLVHPDDDFLAACLLRSPLVALSDDSLVLMALNGGLSRLLDQPGPVLDRLPQGEAALLSNFSAWLGEMRRFRDRVSAAELIEAALEQTDLPAVLLAGHQGREKLAAIQGFIEAARNLAAGPGPQALPDLVERLKPGGDAPPLAVEPVPLEDLDAVRLMTIHKAKGLQFPVVILPQTHGRLRAHYDPVIFRPGMGLAIHIKRVDDARRVSSYSFLELAQAQKAAELEEAHRLLYVALTRAEEKLIISGPYSPPAKSSGSLNNWKKQLDAFRETDAAQGLCYVQPGDSTASPIRQRTGPGLIGPDFEVNDRGRAVVNRVLDPPGPPGRVEISVSHLEDLDLCPRLYFRSRLLGENPWPGGGPGGREKLLSATDRGLWLHKAVELMDLDRPGDLVELAGQAALIGRVATSVAQVKDMAGLLARLVAEPEFAALTGPDRPEVRRELEFSLAHRAGSGLMIINGEVDLLALGRERPLILDWKLARPGRTDYSFQMQTYGLALKKALADPEEAVSPELKLVYLTGQGVTIKPVPFGPAEEEALTRRLDRLAGLLAAKEADRDPAAWPCEPAPGRAEECPFFKGGCCG